MAVTVRHVCGFGFPTFDIPEQPLTPQRYGGDHNADTDKVERTLDVDQNYRFGFGCERTFAETVLRPPSLLPDLKQPALVDAHHPTAIQYEHSAIKK